PAAGGAAAGEPGRGPQGGLRRVLLAHEPAPRRAAPGGPHHPVRGARRPGRTARRPPARLAERTRTAGVGPPPRTAAPDAGLPHPVSPRTVRDRDRKSVV